MLNRWFDRILFAVLAVLFLALGLLAFTVLLAVVTAAALFIAWQRWRLSKRSPQTIEGEVVWEDSVSARELPLRDEYGQAERHRRS
jgi:autotransporter translocation and assembly factor TamB